eukprot:CAMPEP_0177781758 /NCGR_PEP_ID=MMETSP0491_2-20121128/18049_1 /TAXON_ID=63592 /ORGANISM="Tetraselmis chuii, Strain PLY429" /LENGTH=32 /DNA_ID= /DNA_START= /DNA_END= /DNA_ORIENTATION=
MTHLMTCLAQAREPVSRMSCPRKSFTSTDVAK